MGRQAEQISPNDKSSNLQGELQTAGLKLQECVEESMHVRKSSKPFAKSMQSQDIHHHGSSKAVQETAAKKVSLARAQKPELKDVPGFCVAVQQSLSRLDTNGDLRISQSEVDKAMLAPSLRGFDAQMVASLKGSFHDLHKLGSPQWFQLGGLFKEKTIGLKELQKLNDLYQALRVEATNIAQAKEFGARCFANIDANQDDLISAAELDQVIKAGHLSSADKQSALFMRSKFDTFKGASSPSLKFVVSGISRHDLEQVDSYLYNSTFEWQLVAHLWGRLSAFGNEMGKNKDSLYGDAANPLKSIKPDAVRQGEVGDCYFMAALASLSKSSPRTILTTIKDNHNGTFTVTFPGCPDKPITIPKPTQQELALYAKGGKDGIWVAVLEKAFGTYLHGVRRIKATKPIPAEATDGGSPAQALKLLSGKEVDSSVTWFTSADEVAHILERAGKHNKPVVVTTPHTLSSFVGVGDARNLVGLRSGHAFSVIGYDANTKTVTIRDPGGNGDPVGSNGKAIDGINDGIFTMTIDQLKSNFLEIVVVRD